MLVSIGSVLFAKRAVDEARALREIESGRRHDERAPTFRAEIEDMKGRHRMWLVLETGEPIASAKVDITDGGDVYFTDSQTGVEPGVGRTKSAQWGRMTIGTKDAAWRVAIGPDASDQMCLRGTSTIGDESWQVLQTVPLPSTANVAEQIW